MITLILYIFRTIKLLLKTVFLVAASYKCHLGRTAYTDCSVMVAAAPANSVHFQHVLVPSLDFYALYWTPHVAGNHFDQFTFRFTNFPLAPVSLTKAGTNSQYYFQGLLSF